MANETGNIVFQRPHSLLPVVTNFCPGCTHGIVMRLVAESIDELDIEGSTIGIAPVGCSVMAYDFFGCDMVEAAHGRAPAVATGVKRVAFPTRSRKLHPTVATSIPQVIRFAYASC